jgi:ribosomal protein S18 acetylase RimI-like enzyme
MRPGRAADLDSVLDLWRGEVARGQRDCVPGDIHLRTILAGFDWDARSRVVERDGKGLVGAVLVTDRGTPLGTVTRVDASVSGQNPQLLRELTRWGLGLSRAAGAVAAQMWVGQGHANGLDRLNLKMVRPWWRMDRSLLTELPQPEPVDGYLLLQGTDVEAGTWAEVHNGSFADHWRFSPRTEEELVTGRPPGLSLLAVAAAGGSAAALALSQIETYPADPRPQPVGIVSSVGTLPSHRRKGLANWLVAESLIRLRRAGATYASLYVDGWNPTRAFDAYSKLGFDLAFEAEVWEATFR